MQKNLSGVRWLKTKTETVFPVPMRMIEIHKHRTVILFLAISSFHYIFDRNVQFGTVSFVFDTSCIYAVQREIDAIGKGNHRLNLLVHQGM